MRFTSRFVIVISAPLALLVFAFAQACRPAARPSPDVVRVLPLGDSLTEGSRDPHRHQSYRGYLHAMLVQADLRVDFVGTERLTPHGGGDPDHEGHGGFTIGPDEAPLRLSYPAANLYDNLERYLASDPDFVLLLTGINDLLA